MMRLRRGGIAELLTAAALLLAGACGGGNSPAGSSGSGGASGSASGGTSGSSGGAPGSGGGSGGSAVDAPAGDASDGGSLQDTASTDAPAGDASTDGDGGGALALTLPIQRGDLDVLEFGGIAFSMKPSMGARIVSLTLNGDELLADATANAQFFGSTLWTSPANDWVVPGTFVPPPEVDLNPYTTTISADGVITAISAPSTTANGKKFTLTKVFHADLVNRVIVIDYTLTNKGTAAYQLAHWEVTRVHPDGLTFFPTGTTSKVDFLAQILQLKQAQGYTWYDNATHMPNKGESKAGLDSPGGFIAHVAPNAKGDLLFIKQFKAITLAAAPTGHYPIELYCSDPHTYVELEDHSSYDSIAPGASYTQTVHWYLRRLPTGTDRSIGSAALLAAVASALGK